MNINKISNFIQQYFNQSFSYGIIMGSGQHIIDRSSKNLSYGDIPGFTRSRVSGHAGVFSMHKINRKHVLVGAGRFHYYEGYKYNDVVTIIDLFNSLGINNIIITNSSGCLNEGWNLKKLMVADSYIDTTLQVDKSVKKTNFNISNRFKDICNECHVGTYAQVLGPAYETISEINLLKSLGANAVGMSTVPEVRRCIDLKKRFIVICSLTNYASGIIDSVPSHQEVLDNASILNNELNRIIRLVIL